MKGKGMDENNVGQVLNFALQADKLGVVSILILVVFGLVGFCYYTIKALKEPMHQLAENGKVSNELFKQAMDYTRDLNSEIRSDLKEIKIKTESIHDCCKEVRFNQSGSVTYQSVLPPIVRKNRESEDDKWLN
jgi:hypothetical protein|nr:MAG TPA: protein of unknown function (DUF948) [Caudoviricetes sp.]